MNAVLDVDGPVEVEHDIPPPAPLRRPRSPPREAAKVDRDDSGSDRGSKKFVPPGHHPQKSQPAQRNAPSGSRNSNSQPDKQFNKTDRPDKSYRQGPDSNRPPLRRPQVANDDVDRGHGYGSQRQRGFDYNDRRQAQSRVTFASQNRDEDEDWDAPKTTNTAPEPKPIAKKEAAAEPVVSRQTNNLPIKSAERSPAANQRAPAKQHDPPANQKPEPAPATNAKPPGSATDVTPTRKLVPKNCLIDLLCKGDSLLVSVESTEAECHSPGKGYVCLALSEKHAADYTALCEEFGEACEADKTTYKPNPGETFAILNPLDSSWYRARCLSPSHCALLDSARVLPLANARTVRLPARYETQPEFSQVLQATVEVGTTLKCVLLEKTGSGWSVELFPAEGGAARGSGELSRWLPAVQYPPAAAVIPEVSRPPVSHNSTVCIVHVTDCSNVFVRPLDDAAQRHVDTVLHDVAMAGLKSECLTAPPARGSVVISKYTDGLHYRALVKRTNVSQNKYLLEYIEFGNSQVNQLENLFRCPDNLKPESARVLTSQVTLRGVTSQNPLTPAAEQYLDALKDDSVELLLTIPDASESAPSGAEVLLSVKANKENVNKRVEELCTPEWMHLQKKGGDVIETQTIMYSQLQFLDLPQGPCELIVLDISALASGTLSASRDDRPDLFTQLAALTDRMGKYCESELGREPYLPKAEELCIAQMPPYPQWFRAVLAEQVGGPGGAEAEVCYIDYGNMERVPVALLRKMLPEFTALPALANTIEIEDFPSAPNGSQLSRALEHLQLDEEGRGRLGVAACDKTGPGWYKVRAPKLLAAMAQ